MRDIPVRGADDSLDARRVEAVLEVMLDQQIRCRDDDRAEFVERENREPEVVMPLENDHDAVALADSERLEVVRGHRRISRHIPEREASLVLLGVEVEHRELVRTLLGERVDDVKREVELSSLWKGISFSTPFSSSEVSMKFSQTAPLFASE